MTAAVIVGASHGGVQAAASLRQAGWQEPIVLLSAEADYPYHRPPLSKAYLAGEKDEEQLLLRAADFYRDQGIDLRLSDAVSGIDLRQRTVSSASGVTSFSKLILATGSRARALPLAGADAANVFTLRSIGDARLLRNAMASASSVVVIGGGFIGLEFASTAIKNGLPVTVLETQSRLLSRSLPAVLADHLRDYHAAKGVQFRFGSQIEALDVENGAVKGVRLADGTTLVADLVLVGIGGQAEAGLAGSIGLDLVAGGIHVDGHGQTSAPDIYALGDVATFHNAYADAAMRLESVQNAVDQAKAASAHIVGGNAPLTSVPWFWTDQYDLKVQMAGLGKAGSREVVRGDPSSGAFSVLQLDGERLLASYTVNRAADHMASRKLIGEGIALDLAQVTDISVPLLRAVKG